MKIHDFEYAGRKLSSFDMIVCNFGDKGLDTISNGATITFNTIPTQNGAHHKLSSTTYEECLTSTIQICRNPCNSDTMEISPSTFRSLTGWLSRKQFLKFKPLSEEYADLYFESIINVSRIELDGKIVGLELEINCNRPFALKEPHNIVIQARYLYAWEKFYIVNGDEKGQSSNDYVFSYDRDAYPDDGCVVDDNGSVTSSYYYVFANEKTEFKNQYSINDTSYEEGYIYPEMEITIKQAGDLEIYNAIENRKTYIADCRVNEQITLNYPVIQSSDSSHNIQNDFNWTFFRVANTYGNSRNDLTISLPCSIKIKYSPIVKVGL